MREDLVADRKAGRTDGRAAVSNKRFWRSRY
jgi:hypothetical protein